MSGNPNNLVQRIIRWMRPESTDLQDATEDDITFDREKVDKELEKLLHSARRTRRSADAFIVTAELLVKDVRGEPRSKESAKNTSRSRSSK
jgi:hypothetical protein